MKKLLMSAAFIALVGTAVPADAGSTLAIGGGPNLGHVRPYGRCTLGTAAAGSRASGTNTSVGCGVPCHACGEPQCGHRHVCGSVNPSVGAADPNGAALSGGFSNNGGLGVGGGFTNVLP